MILQLKRNHDQTRAWETIEVSPQGIHINRFHPNDNALFNFLKKHQAFVPPKYHPIGLLGSKFTKKPISDEH